METNAPRPRAVLVAVQLPGVSDEDHAGSLAELGRLVHTLGYEVVATLSQKRSALAGGAVLGSGKLKELAKLTGGTGVVPSGVAAKKSKARARFEGADAEEGEAADEELPRDGSADAPEDEDEGEGGEEPPSDDAAADAAPKATVVVVDHDISPSQARNLERATAASVLDRTGVIVEIFHRHARSREAKLQVEIARLSYVAPRMRESSGGGRQQGPGAGESELELDRRKIRDRIAELREALAVIQKDNDHRRHARRDQLRVALVGYTNAGKSSLMRALTGSEVLVADKLFATLDTTVRALHPETRPRVLISDTVGFIKKLPHDLVASFRSTLDEALEASLLLHVVDASDPTFESQLQVTLEVLREIGADAVPSRLLLNKMDKVAPEERAALTARFPDALQLSAKAPEDVAALRQHIIDYFDGLMVEDELVLPYARQALLGEVFEHARVVKEAYDETGRRMTVRGLPGGIARLRRALASA
ncbi:GTPase HflX [Vitiosangium sp. GDMCC 1.1324]|uniref:GTPase HflX n=1 Tax=Vitiosangium sp. (strain GDMCC 1.1324) TaxID=2138576 RepID=UPI000D37D528|nr:GTPase HflX [Vitiosangium sp. GDMCC 1.1324]PTL84635.1 GTPase HflX [Vitiosangium sp. GDMCC 1.1324]